MDILGKSPLGHDPKGMPQLSYSATGPENRDAGDARRHQLVSVIFVSLTILALFIRFCVPPELMNTMMNYTTENGSFYEKLHLGTYATFLVLPVALFSRPFTLEGDDIRRFKDVLRFSGLVLLLIVFLLVTGRASAAGLFIDSYLVAGAAGLVTLSLGRDYKRVVGEAVLWMNLAHAVIGTGEFIAKHRLIASTLVEDSFRPTGLTDHPLTLGLVCAGSIGFVVMTSWKPWAKVAAIIVLLVGTAAAGARFALLLAAVEILMLIILVPWTRLSRRTERKAKFATLLLALVGGAGLFAVLAAGGALSRFEGGVVDQNFFARTDIYQIFNYVSWQDIMFGADLEGIVQIVNEELKLPFIESSPVYMTFLLGAPLAIAFAALLAWLFLRMLQHAGRPVWIGTLVFFAAALSNNTLSSKTPVVATFLVLVIAYSGVRQAVPPAAARD